ncbi:MAG: hypothetical protein IJ560_03705 [Alphaproteobacteria bacterium]|nr:hypothetical protein [Alphaproteobacteria bacterium]
MKKFGAMVIALGALAACSGNDAIDVMGQKCTKVAMGENGEMLVKCPVTEDLTGLRAVEANAMLITADANVEEIAADKDSIYMNVVPATETIGTCYRILVNEPVFDGTTMNALEICESATK